jgi:hypothetical protein
MWSAIAADQPGINQLYASKGAELLGHARLQGIACNVFRQPLGAAGGSR